MLTIKAVALQVWPLVSLHASQVILETCKVKWLLGKMKHYLPFSLAGIWVNGPIAWVWVKLPMPIMNHLGGPSKRVLPSHSFRCIMLCVQWSGGGGADSCAHFSGGGRKTIHFVKLRCFVCILGTWCRMKWKTYGYINISAAHRVSQAPSGQALLWQWQPPSGKALMLQPWEPTFHSNIIFAWENYWEVSEL